MQCVLNTGENEQSLYVYKPLQIKVVNSSVEFISSFTSKE